MPCRGPPLSARKVWVTRTMVDIFDVPLLVLPQTPLFVSALLTFRRLKRVFIIMHLPACLFGTTFNIPVTWSEWRAFRPNRVTELGRIR